MADIVDNAQAYEERERQAAIERAGIAKQYGISHTVCIECGEPIGAARMKAIIGARRCAYCQGELEAGNNG